MNINTNMYIYLSICVYIIPLYTDSHTYIHINSHTYIHISACVLCSPTCMADLTWFSKAVTKEVATEKSDKAAILAHTSTPPPPDTLPYTTFV